LTIKFDRKVQENGYKNGDILFLQYNSFQNTFQPVAKKLAFNFFYGKTLAPALHRTCSCVR